MATIKQAEVLIQYSKKEIRDRLLEIFRGAKLISPDDKITMDIVSNFLHGHDSESIMDSPTSEVMFSSENLYEGLLKKIFEYLLMEYYPEKFLVTYVTGDDYDKVDQTFIKYVHRLKNGDMNHWLHLNNLKDENKYEGNIRVPSKEQDLILRRHKKALELFNLNNEKNEVLLKLMSMVNPTLKMSKAG